MYNLYENPMFQVCFLNCMFWPAAASKHRTRLNVFVVSFNAKKDINQLAKLLQCSFHKNQSKSEIGMFTGGLAAALIP